MGLQTRWTSPSSPGRSCSPADCQRQDGGFHPHLTATVLSPQPSLYHVRSVSCQYPGMWDNNSGWPAMAQETTNHHHHKQRAEVAFHQALTGNEFSARTSLQPARKAGRVFRPTFRSVVRQEGSMKDTRNHLSTSSQFAGSARVDGATYNRRTTTLKLRTFAGEEVDYTVSDIPDPAGAAEFRKTNPRPISVKIRQGGKWCSVIALTADGTQRTNVAPGIALALHQTGVHTVVDGGLLSGVSCSTHN